MLMYKKIKLHFTLFLFYLNLGHYHYLSEQYLVILICHKDTKARRFTKTEYYNIIILRHLNYPLWISGQ